MNQSQHKAQAELAVQAGQGWMETIAKRVTGVNRSPRDYADLTLSYQMATLAFAQAQIHATLATVPDNE